MYAVKHDCMQNVTGHRHEGRSGKRYDCYVAWRDILWEGMSLCVPRMVYTYSKPFMVMVNRGKQTNKQTNSVVWVLERTRLTERSLVGVVSANFCGLRVSRGQRGGSLRRHSRLSRPEPLLFLPSSSSVVLTRLSGPRSRPTTSQETW
jgi:hypothetical protein